MKQKFLVYRKHQSDIVLPRSKCTTSSFVHYVYFCGFELGEGILVAEQCNLKPIVCKFNSMVIKGHSYMLKVGKMDPI